MREIGYLMGYNGAPPVVAAIIHQFPKSVYEVYVEKSSMLWGQVVGENGVRLGLMSCSQGSCLYIRQKVVVSFNSSRGLSSRYVDSVKRFLAKVRRMCQHKCARRNGFLQFRRFPCLFRLKCANRVNHLGCPVLLRSM